MLNCGEEGALSGKFGIHRGWDSEKPKKEGISPLLFDKTASMNSKHFLICSVDGRGERI